MTRKSKPLQHLADVLHPRRRGKTVRDVLAPFLEIGRAAEIGRVVFHRRPFDEQPVAGRLLDRALQLQAVAALGALEHRRGVFHAGFELGFHAGLDVDLCDFGDHDGSIPAMRMRAYPSGAPKTRKIAGLAIRKASSAARQRGAWTAATSDSPASGTMAASGR